MIPYGFFINKTKAVYDLDIKKTALFSEMPFFRIDFSLINPIFGLNQSLALVLPLLGPP